jgi:hypothetical protein
METVPSTHVEEHGEVAPVAELTVPAAHGAKRPLAAA